MKKNKAIVNVQDPIVEFWEELKIYVPKLYPKINLFDAIIFAVKHEEYRKINFNKWVNRRKMLIVDANNVLSEKQHSILAKKKYNVISIGRG